MGLSTGSSLSSDGGGSSGLSTSQVNSLIEAKSQWEFIKKIDVTGNISSLRISDGIDATKYDGYLYEFKDIKIDGGSQYMSWRVRNSGGSSYGVYMIAHRHSTGYQYSNNSNQSLFYSNGSQTFGVSDRINARVEVYPRDTFIIGYIKTSQGTAGGFWNHHTDGNFLIDPSNETPSDFGEFEAAFEMQSGSVSIYGQRIRSAS
jgi:hypothetical protein